MAVDEARSLVKLAHEGGALPQAPAGTVADAIALMRGSVPMKRLDQESQVRALGAVKAALMPIGAKLAPNMDPKRADAWADAIAISLSKYPARVAIAAATRAQTEPLRYIGDVDSKLHEFAAEIEQANALALRRLEFMQDQIARASQPKLTAEPPPPLTIAEISRLSESLIRMGLSTGEITEDQVREARKFKEEARKTEEFDAGKNDAIMAPTEGKPVGDLI